MEKLFEFMTFALLGIEVSTVFSFLLWIKGRQNVELDRDRKNLNILLKINQLLIGVGPLTGLLGTNLLGAYALLQSGKLFTGNAAPEQMANLFTIISGAMFATVVGVVIALLAFVVKLISDLKFKTS